MLKRSSAAISPTAHYTGEVWRRNGLSHPALGTWQGRALHASAAPLMALSRAVGGDKLEDFLLARHALIDRVLEGGIEEGIVSQVVEIAAGMSPRGIRLTGRHPSLSYTEADLPAMAARKREALSRADSAAGRINVVDLDVLAEPGDPLSLAACVKGLDPAGGLAIVTEGLLNYFPRESVGAMWRSIASELSGFSHGLYVTDLHLGESNSGTVQRVFLTALSAFVRGRVHMPYRDSDDADAALQAAGFSRVRFRAGTEGGAGRGAGRVVVIEAGLGGAG